ncbi:MAG: hypothetical protein LBG19_10635 [Prevotellaceae bacterium]|jgi:hypothetical protein|nr:hypothetical protein [Prevotellaceae bacterium]
MVKHVYEIDRDELKAAFSDALLTLTKEQILDKFSMCQVHSSTVCDIWDITPQTLTSYVNAGIVIPVNKGSGKYLFNLADILAMPNPKRRRNAVSMLAKLEKEAE